MDAPSGFEPEISDSESLVMPFHYRAMAEVLINYQGRYFNIKSLELALEGKIQLYQNMSNIFETCFFSHLTYDSILGLTAGNLCQKTS